MEEYCLSRISLFPYARYTSQGTITAASPQAVLGSSAFKSIRNYKAHISVCPLIRCQITEPFGIEFFCVKVIGRCLCKGLCISRPSETLVSLRAVGGNIQEIIFLGPEDVLDQPV